MAVQLGYVILYVPELEPAVAFYEAAFGLQRRFVHESGYAEMQTGATALGFAVESLAESNGGSFRPNRQEEPPAAIEIAFTTGDVSSMYKQALAAGATAVKAPMQKPWGQTVAYVRDLNGILVEICTPVA